MVSVLSIPKEDTSKRFIFQNPQDNFSGSLPSITHFAFIPNQTPPSSSSLPHSPTSPTSPISDDISSPPSSPSSSLSYSHSQPSSPRSTSSSNAYSKITFTSSQNKYPSGIEKLKKRPRPTSDQVLILWKAFNENPMPNTSTRQRLASQLNMTPRAVQIWFQNRRQWFKTRGLKEMNSKNGPNTAKKNTSPHLHAPSHSHSLSNHSNHHHHHQHQHHQQQQQQQPSNHASLRNLALPLPSNQILNQQRKYLFPQGELETHLNPVSSLLALSQAYSFPPPPPPLPVQPTTSLPPKNLANQLPPLQFENTQKDENTTASSPSSMEDRKHWRPWD